MYPTIRFEAFNGHWKLGANSLFYRAESLQNEQGIALTGRNTTGPPRAAAGELRSAVECYRRGQTTTTDDDRHQLPLLVLPLH